MEAVAVTVTDGDDNGEAPRGLSGPLPDRLAGGGKPANKWPAELVLSYVGIT